MGRRESPRESEALGLLGLARRAGAVSRGVDATRRSLESGEVRLVLFATDASETQFKKVRNLIRRRGVPVLRISDRDLLGRAVGRSALSVVGVTERSFARQLLERVPQMPSGSLGQQELEGAQEEQSSDAGY